MTQIQFNNALIGLSDKLRFYALKLTSDSEKADDLLQETFLKALTYRDKFTQDTNFKAWIYTIMKNTFINDYRKNVRSVQTYKGSTSDVMMNFSMKMGFDSSDSYYNSKEINISIQKLEDEFRIPFTLFIDGYKYKEIAEKLNLPLGTVKSRIFFTRKKLEKMLKDYSYDA